MKTNLTRKTDWHILFPKSALAVLLALLAPASLRAGTITVVNLPATGTDAASGISSANTYLDAFDFGNDGGASTPIAISINSVPFTHYALGGTANNTVQTLSTTDAHFGGTLTLTSGGPGPDTDRLGQASNAGQGSLSAQADGNMRTLLTDMIYVTGPADPNAWLEQDYGGLTIGDSYSLRIYYRYWGNTNPGRPLDVYFDGEGTQQAYSANPLNEDDTVSSSGARYLEYDFTASSSDVTCTLYNLVGNGSAQIFGATLQVPEPSALALAGFGWVGVMLVIRRRSKH